jgi:hypothetical protein
VPNGLDFSGFGIIFNRKMMVDPVHGSWTAGGSVHHGALGGTDRRPPERGGTLAGVWSRTAPELDEAGEGRVWRGEDGEAGAALTRAR